MRLTATEKEIIRRFLSNESPESIGLYATEGGVRERNSQMSGRDIEQVLRSHIRKLEAQLKKVKE